ncbi:hypothetical protein BA897_00065 [Spiribacter roseus]|nr:hypothetical protein BA897_00065 [Spiribacter roseus]
MVATFRAQERLKPIADTTGAIVNGRNSRPIARERELLMGRLDREIRPDDRRGEDLRQAVVAFFEADNQATRKEIWGDVLDAYHDVRAERWQAVVEQHGKISHYFDPRWGKLRPRYRDGPKKTAEPEPTPVFIELLAKVAAYLHRRKRSR